MTSWREFDVDAHYRRLAKSSSSIAAAPLPTEIRRPANRAAHTASAATPLVGLCKSAGLPVPATEYVFHPARKWRFDYAWPAEKISVEIEGGIWSDNQRAKAAHALPLAIERDMEKYNAAAVLGWRVLRYTPANILGAINDLTKMLALGGADTEHA
jgi:hypothetical protein